ncbi:hypothetical protein [Saccharibacillus qingshengii]|uniref:hypothetical protein n=1 Tax=Saccharibacillus qingshengii TaxID=1763540 RepID=UPI0015550AB3|nr:hypothetical protein [Saccharibacillus qingshengii]
MNRFKTPEDRREDEAGKNGRPNWYEALAREPGPMSTEPTLAQMRKIKEESDMEHTQGSTKRRGKQIGGVILAAAVVFGGLWGANSAGWLDGETPKAAYTQASPGSDPGSVQTGGGIVWQTEEEAAESEKEAETQARAVAENFKREDLTVTQAQKEVFEKEFRQGEQSMLDWIEQRHAELSVYAEKEFLSNYFTNRAADMPYEAAIRTDSELTVENLKMTTRSIKLEIDQVTFDYTLDLVFSGEQDPLPMKGSIRMEKGKNGWKVLKDTPDKEGFLALYKLAWPEPSPPAEDTNADEPAK